MRSSRTTAALALLPPLTLATLLSIPLPAAADCVDYDCYLHITGAAASSGHCFFVAVQGDFAYGTTGYMRHAFVVTDITDPAHPATLGSLDLTWPLGVNVSGPFAYVADSGWLLVMNVTNPADPRLVAGAQLPSEGRGVSISGTTAFVACGTAGLCIVNIADPMYPVVITTFDTPGNAQAVALDGPFAFVADASRGLEIVDVSDRTNPVLIGGVDTPSTAQDVVVSGTHAFVADGYAGLQVVDITAPAAPFIAGSVATPGLAGAVAVSGAFAYVGHAYVFDERSGLQSINVSDPSNPRIAGLLSMASVSDFDISTSGFLCAAAGALVLVDLARPEGAPALGTTEFVYGSGSRIITAGTRAYVAAGSALLIADIGDPSAPAMVGYREMPATDVAVSGTTAYVVGDDGLHVVNVTDPVKTEELGMLSFATSTGIAVAGRYAYVTRYGSPKLDVINVFDPGQPRLVGSVALHGASSVTVSGTHAIVSAGLGGLEIVNVSLPRLPRVVGRLDTYHEFRQAYVAGSLVYAANVSGLSVIDLAEPSSPQLISELEVVGAASGITLLGNYAYVATGSCGLDIVNVTSPASPRHVGVFCRNAGQPGAAAAGDVICAIDISGSPYGRTIGVDVLARQCDAVTAVPVPPGTPPVARVLFAAPNPTAHGTTFHLVADGGDHPVLTIHDVRGRAVCRLDGCISERGVCEFAWDGCDGAGRPVAPGVYVAHVSTPGHAASTRVIVSDHR